LHETRAVFRAKSVSNVSRKAGKGRMICYQTAMNLFMAAGVDLPSSGGSGKRPPHIALFAAKT
jgi:hypothetical protein